MLIAVKLYFCKLYYYLKYLVIELITRHYYIIHGYFPLNDKGKIGHYNLGDDLNLYLLPLISSVKVIPFQYSLLSHLFRGRRRYSCIGSILSSSDKETIIWGSGAIIDTLDNKFRFKDILSVRGPLTRNLLIENGYNCPQNYGDPALLLSKYYKPEIKKKYKLGIIPHYIDHDTSFLCRYVNVEDVIVIDFHNYSDWKDPINQIASCDFILSSSLHGLIISDSYKIPNLWCKFSDKVYGNDFKYKDYLLSVCREKNTRAFVFDRYYDIHFLLSLKSQYFSPIVDYNAIMFSCPFIK